MVRNIMKDLLFLGQKAEPASREDIAIAEKTCWTRYVSTESTV